MVRPAVHRIWPDVAEGVKQSSAHLPGCLRQELDRASAEIRTLLRDKYDVNLLADLRRVDLRDIQPAISAHLIELLTCLLYYPDHDSGPTCDWERLLKSAPIGHYAAYPGNPFHTHFGPVFYRGRLDDSAPVLVVGQDPSSDETLAGRVFVGLAGQRAQTFLHKLGITRSYLMFNTFLFGVQSGSITTALATDPTIQAHRNQLFDRAMATNSLSLILAFGSWASTSVQNWPGRGSIPFVALTHPNCAERRGGRLELTPLDRDGERNPRLGRSPGFDAVLDVGTPPSTDIPRRDLPFGLPSWRGTGGTRSQRASGAFETQINWTAP